MVEPESVSLRVPASSANLGPGFDCLGLALDVWNEATFTLEGDSHIVEIEGEGADLLPHDGRNLILQTAAHLFQLKNVPFPQGIHLQCRNAIPISSGLGSSSAAIITGLLGARKLLGQDISNYELLSLAADFEGHADNVAPCLLGGLVIALPEASRWVAEKVSIQPLKAVIAFPAIKLSTQEARAALPDSLSRQNAIANIGRSALLVHALRENRKDLLATAMHDSLHQPYRLKLLPGAQEALQAAYAAGAYGAALSGAGPSLIAFADGNHEAIGAAMQHAFKQASVDCRIIQTQSTDQGAIYI